MAEKTDINQDQQVKVERVRAWIRARFNPIRSLTPELLAQNLDSFKAGYIRQAMLVWADIEERDDLLASVAPKRKKAVARNGYEIVTVETDNPAVDAHREALVEFWDNVTVTNALDENEQGELGLLVRQMADAIGKRYAVHEVVYQPGDVFTAQFRFVPGWFFENTTGRLRYLASEGAIDGVAMDPAAWLVTVGDGLMAACSVAYIYKQLSLKDWVVYNERHGMPGIHGKTDAQVGSPQWEALVDAVANFAADWSMVTNNGATLEKVDMSVAGELPYPPLVERMDRAMAAIWRGADLSTMSAGSGDGTGASLQGDESALLEQDDCRWISETLSRQIDRRVIEYRFGRGVKPLAYIKIKSTNRRNVDQDLKVDEALNRMGAPLAIAATLERYDRPMPGPDDAVLPRPAAPALPGLALPNEATGKTSATVDALLQAREQLLAPLLEELAEIDADTSLTPDQYLAKVEDAVARIGELLTPEALAKLAAPLEQSMRAAVETALQGAARKPEAAA